MNTPYSFKVSREKPTVSIFISHLGATITIDYDEARTLAKSILTIIGDPGPKPWKMNQAGIVIDSDGYYIATAASMEGAKKLVDAHNASLGHQQPSESPTNVILI